MTPEHEAQARKLLAQIAKTHEWARTDCPGPDWLREHGLTPFDKDGKCFRCGGEAWIPLADLEVAAWRAVVWLAQHETALFTNRQGDWWTAKWNGDSYSKDAPLPIIAVFKAVLELSKEKS